MIYTITFSPALDYILEVNKLDIGEINRTTFEKILPGGKGINVSIVLKNLETESVASGFISGFTGQYIKDSLENSGIKTDFVDVKNGFSRINVKIEKPIETAINGSGPKISEENIDELFSKLESLTDKDLICFNGKFPETMNKEKYLSLLSHLKEKNIEFIVDTTGSYLIDSLEFNPLLVKPNKEELEEIIGKKISSNEELLASAKELVNKGAKYSIISLGGDGALFVSKNDYLFAKAPAKKVINTVGAGDSVVAGFIDKYLKTNNPLEAFKWGVCCGSASAYSSELAILDDVKELYKGVNERR